MASLQERVKQSEVGQFLRYANKDFNANAKSRATLDGFLIGGIVGATADYFLPRVLPAEPFFAFNSIPNIFLEGVFPLVLGRFLWDYVPPTKQASLYLGSIMAQAIYYGIRFF